MCWHDRTAAETIHKLAYDFNIRTFVETGTFKGVNAKYQSKNFGRVMSCEINPEYFKIAEKRTVDCPNVYLFNQSSPEFLMCFKLLQLQIIGTSIVFIYLDAHFYDPNLPPEDRWVVLKELEALKEFRQCFVCIHDFDCSGLGHLTYDGQPLNFDLVVEKLTKVNPNFYYYCNTREHCEIHTEASIIGVPGMEADEDTIDNIQYSHTDDRRKYRGMLYCSPVELDLSRYELVELKHPLLDDGRIVKRNEKLITQETL